MSKSTHPTSPPPSRKLEEVVADQQGVLSPQDTVQEAGDKMRALKAEVLPVSEERRLVGVVDEPNPDRTAAGHGHDPKSVLIGESMNRKLVYCYEDQDVSEARRVMDEANLQVLPIVDRQLRIVGMLHRQELEEPAARKS